jgi:predicted amidohydrolase
VSVNFLSCITPIDAFTTSSIPSSFRNEGSSTIGQSDLAMSTGVESLSEIELSSIEKFRAAVYQPPALEENESKVQKENPLEILTQVADALRVASAHGVDIVVFPELYLNGGPKRVLSGDSAPLDRESYELNIVGNLCEELHVACVVGYAELKHESETKTRKTKNRSSHGHEDGDSSKNGVFNSIAIFNANGSRAGNYRSVNPHLKDELSTTIDFITGHPLIEVMPTLLQLPTKKKGVPRELKVGLMCGRDLLMPEHCRHLARNGAQIIVSSASFQTRDFSMVKHVCPTRSIENGTPLLISNYVDQTLTQEPGEKEEQKDSNELSFIGSSAIISQLGEELVRAPRNQYSDMPCDDGYLLPCDVGALYAADIDVATEILHRNYSENRGFIETSMNQWDLAPRTNVGTEDNVNKRNSKGFGREVQKILGRQNAGRKRK